MKMLAQDERCIFLGQAVEYPGTAMSGTLADVPDGRRIEMPVAEEMQMGATIGLALQGFIPVSIYPRWNFLLLAANQLVNHLDKLPIMSGYRPRAIIRVGVGSESPLHPGAQHTGNFEAALSIMCDTIRFVRLPWADGIATMYRRALRYPGVTVITEISDRYND